MTAYSDALASSASTSPPAAGTSRPRALAARSRFGWTDYLAAVEGADDEYAETAACGPGSVLAGDSDDTEMVYPCHSPTGRRWSPMRARPMETDGERNVVVSAGANTDPTGIATVN